MKNSAAESAPQSLFARLGWFAVGGCLSVGINAAIFYITQHRLGWTDAAAYAASLTIVTVVFSLWNYFLNFRTTAAWRDCLVRYLAAIVLCYAINYAITLTGFRQLATQPWMKYAIIGAVQVGMSGVKFFLYHRWVYPSEKKDCLLPRGS